MRGAMLHAPGDIRVEQREDPKIIQPTDAIIRLSATCVCGSDLLPYRGIEPVDGPAPMGHEYAGIVEEVGADVRGIKPGQFVVGSFFASDGTLVATADVPSEDLVPSLLAASDVLGASGSSR
jgi:threonine dehydrogenase-like Zn-dependent dehydrogenase